MAAKKNIVLVGGGPANLAVISQLHKAGLQDKVNITLVSDCDYYESNYAAPRFLVTSADDNFVRYDRATVDFPTMFGNKGTVHNKSFNVTFVHGKASGIDGEAVTHSGDGGAVPFDFLVLATGVSYPTMRPDDSPNLEARKAQVKAQADSYAEAAGIIVLGGGSVGVETIGELQEKYPDKKLYLISHTILPNSSKWAQDSFKKNLEKRGVTILLDDQLVESDGSTHKTKSGQTIQAEVVIKCFAEKPNSGFMLGGPYESAVDDKGFIKVDKTLKVVGSGGKAIYCMGDVANLKHKTSVAQEKQYKAMIANIQSMLEGKEQKAEYDGKPMAEGDLMVSAGMDSHGGIVCCEGFCALFCAGFCCCCCLGTGCGSKPESRKIANMKGDFVELGGMFKDTPHHKIDIKDHPGYQKMQK